MTLTSFKNILGKPNTGFHKLHIGKVAIGDFILTIIIAFIIGQYTSMPATIALIILLISAIILHALFGVTTPTTQYLGIN